MKGVSFVKSHYSILESNVKIHDLLAKARDFNYEYLTLSDNNLHGTLDFVYGCQKNNIKPLVALEVKVKDEELSGLIHILPDNQKGFSQISNLSTEINVNKLEVSLEYLFSNCGNTSVIIPLNNQIFGSKPVDDKEIKINKLITKLKKHFKNVYLGVDNKTQIDYSQINATPIIFNSVLFIEEEDFLVPDILRGIKNLETIDINSKKFQNNHLFSPEAIEHKFSKELIKNTNDFFENNFFIHNFKKTQQPEFLKNKNKTKFLKELCFDNLGKKLNMKILDETYTKRLDYELSIIKKLDFENYFLIVWDFVKFAKDNKISVGPGRGSAAGSLVSFALNITEADPIKYNLLFERFLNIDRISMPDIDLDFEDERREDVINYVYEKYGSKHVAYISTFQTIGPKMAIRDVGRCLNVPLSQANLLAKKVPNKPKMTIQGALDMSIGFRKEANKNYQNLEIIRISKLIEGTPRQLGTHAAGIILSAKPLREFVPLTISKNSNILQSQYSMHHLEKLGLLKMDFLGIRNLTTIKNIIGMVKDNLGEEIDINAISLNDIKTFKMLSSGMTEGIFQLESRGMKEVLQGIQPRSVEELAIALSLYRPGPLNNIPLYIKRKTGQEKVSYLHQDLKPILKNTQGIIVYQEQIMQIAHKISGFSYSKSDILRRAMSKKDVKAMMLLEEEFISGAKLKGYDPKMAKEIYDLIYAFANYGFNSAHSISYSLTAYKLAYLKAHFPRQFLVSLLTNNVSNDEKLQKYLHEAKKINIEIKPPSINRSYQYFVHYDNSIYFPLSSIKSIGGVLAKEILNIRKDKGPFTSFSDFVIKTMNTKLSQGNIESLIKAGCFDEFNHSRKSLLNILADMIKYANLLPQENKGKLFEIDLIPVPKIKDIEDDVVERLNDEKEMLGFYITNHPIKILKNQIMKKLKNNKISDISQISQNKFQENTAIFAVVKSLRIIQTQKKETMIFTTLVDDTSEIEAVVFPREFKRVGHKLVKDKYFGIRGKFDRKNQTFIIEGIKTQEEILS